MIYLLFIVPWVLVILLIVSLAIRDRRIRRQMKMREPLPDDVFVQRLGAPNEHAEIIVCLRNIFGRFCKIPPETIFPDDTPDTFGPILADGWDDLDLIMDLEDHLGVQIDTLDGSSMPFFLGARFFWWHRPAAESFGSWCIEFVQWANNRMKTDQ